MEVSVVRRTYTTADPPVHLTFPPSPQLLFVFKSYSSLIHILLPTASSVNTLKCDNYSLTICYSIRIALDIFPPWVILRALLALCSLPTIWYASLSPFVCFSFSLHPLPPLC